MAVLWIRVPSYLNKPLSLKCALIGIICKNAGKIVLIIAIKMQCHGFVQLFSDVLAHMFTHI